MRNAQKGETGMDGEKNRMSAPCFFAKMLKGFLEEAEEEKKKRRKRRRHNRSRFADMDDMYCGFGNRYGEDEDDEEDGIEDEEEENIFNDDDDEEDDWGRGCGPADRKNTDSIDMMKRVGGLGRYFNASDYDEDYEE